MKLLKEFKDFALKGNVIDLAVGVVIGSAFGAIVTSLTNDIIMPPIGWFIGGVNFSELKIAISEKIVGDTVEVVYIQYGKFIQTIINFLIIAFSIFVAVKFINKLKRKEEAQPATPPAPSKEETLLTEIRDILKNQNK